MVSRVKGSTEGTNDSLETKMADQPSPRKALRQRLRFPFFRPVPSPVDANETDQRDGPLTSSSSEETMTTSLQQQTRIVTVLEPPLATSRHHNDTLLDERGPAHPNDDVETALEPTGPFCASAALLRHSYLERMCGVDTRQIQGDEVVQRLDALPEDPSPQESIECVFAAQLALLDLEDDELWLPHKDLPTPSSLQQCLLKNRLNAHLPPQFLHSMSSKSPRRAPIPHPMVVSTYTEPPTDPKVETYTDQPEVHNVTNTAEVTAPVVVAPLCHCARRLCPILEPEQWPQRPLLLRPTPYGGTVVKGIRFAGQTDYLWSAADSPTSSIAWPDALQSHWASQSSPSKPTHDFSNQCPHCMILPINNGKEPPGESLVVDFESDAFDGSILIRLKGCQGTTCPARENPKGYFDGLHRRYQVVIRGRFKHEIPWTECYSGFQLEQPPGKLPPKWIVNGTLNVVRFFAPLLQTSISGPRPYSLTPLGSTPQALIVNDECHADITMEASQEEPKVDNLTLLGHSSTAASSLQRARYRKKHFDKMYSENTPSLLTDPNKVYTFEFLQHLLSFDDFSIELGSIVGSVPLQGILNGQPLQIMASHKHPVPRSTNTQNRLFSFDIWHESLVADSAALDEAYLASVHG